MWNGVGRQEVEWQTRQWSDKRQLKLQKEWVCGKHLRKDHPYFLALYAEGRCIFRLARFYQVWKYRCILTIKLRVLLLGMFPAWSISSASSFTSNIMDFMNFELWWDSIALRWKRLFLHWSIKWQLKADSFWIGNENNLNKWEACSCESRMLLQ